MHQTCNKLATNLQQKTPAVSTSKRFLFTRNRSKVQVPLAIASGEGTPPQAVANLAVSVYTPSLVSIGSHVALKLYLFYAINVGIVNRNTKPRTSAGLGLCDALNGLQASMTVF